MAQIYENIAQKFQLRHLNINYGDVLQSNSDDRDNINDKLIKILEDSRDEFENGFPAFGIPPLDPLGIDKVNFYLYQKGVIRAPFDVYDIFISGLKDFVINNFNFQIGDLTLNFDFTIPELILTSKYTANGKLASVFPFNPRGNARIEMCNMAVKGIANLKTTSKKLKIRAFNIYLNVEKTKVNFSGLLGNGFINKILNWVLNRLSDRVVQGHKDNLANAAAIEIMDMVNSILKNITLMDLIGN